MTKYWIILLLFVGFTACKNEEDTEEVTATEEIKNVTSPIFNGDSAFLLIKKQLSFGPRIPNTPAQKKCAEWIEASLKSVCDTVLVQSTTVKVKDGQVPCINIMGQINPNLKRRIVLFAHWDTRPWADKEDKNKKLDGADDGASGVAVLIQMANIIKANPVSNIGIDFVFFDVEDYGTEEENSYCVGSQYWTTHPPIVNYNAEFGILLDMVGGKGTEFKQEQMSMTYAASVVNKVWNTANSLGYQSLFKYSAGIGVTDDHVYVNKNMGIPTIDIIGTHHDEFPTHHHTTKDNIDAIDANTLKSVGQTLIQLIYNENSGIDI